MKSGWEIKSIGEFCTLATGGTPKRSENCNFEGGEIKWLVSGDIHRKYIETCEGRITQKGFQSSNAKFLPVNSIMIALNGQGKTRGTVALLKTEATCNQSLVSIMPNDTSKILPEYLFVNLHGRYEEIRRITGDSGNDRRGLNMNLIRSIKVPIPPLEEQRYIVSMLDLAFAALDRARENVEANLTDSSALCQAAIDSALEGVEGKCITLSDHLSIKHGFAFKSKDFEVSSDGALPVVLTPGNYTESATLNLNTKKTKRLTGAIPNDYLFSKGDLTIVMTDLSSKMKILGQPAFIGGAEKVLHNQRIGKIIFKDEQLHPSFLYFLLRTTKLKEHVKSTSTGTMVKHTSPSRILSQIVQVPNCGIEQANIANRLFSIVDKTEALVSAYKTKLVMIANLRQSIIERAFVGELKEASPINDNESDERLSTATLVLAFEKHRIETRQKTFGHVKAQKTLHLTEVIGGLELGRRPQVRQAGPHDQEHFDRVEAWAVLNDIFRFVRRSTGQRGYDFVTGKNYDAFLSESKLLLADYQAGFSRFLPLMTQMNTEEAEVFTTVHAAWNNLLVDGKSPSDDEIVYAAREGWHESKTNIDRQKFFDAIRVVRRHDLEPDGSAKYVHGAQESLL